MASLLWAHSRRSGGMEGTVVMNVRRWNPNFPPPIGAVKRTIEFLVICLSFHGLLADNSAVLGTSQPTLMTLIGEGTSRGIPSELSASSSSSLTTNSMTTTQPVVTRSKPEATHLPSLLTLSTNAGSTNPPTTLSEPRFQPPLENARRNSIGYVAEWEYEGTISPAIDEVEESFGTEQVSPLRNAQSHSAPSPGKSEDSGGGGFGSVRTPPSGKYPSRRVGPGTWQDSRRSWWLFGGQGPTDEESPGADKSIHYLSDLWVYDHEKSSWRLVFHPESDTSPIHSAYPENLAFPHVCGSEANGHIAVFGGGGITGSTNNLKTNNRQGKNRGLPFTDDNVVWLFDVPINKSSGERNGDGSGGSSSSSSSIQLDSSWDSSSGLWTSYICCDACLPDGNTSLEFCPRFSREPILWCGQDSLMALQISHVAGDSGRELLVEKEDKGTRPEETSRTPLNGDINGGTSEGENRDPNTEAQSRRDPLLVAEIISTDPHHPKSPSVTKPDINPTGSSSTITTTTTTTTTATATATATGGGINRPMDGGRRRRWNSLRATWWKFDLAATEWEKMPEVNVTGPALDLIEKGDCRTVSDQQMVYIICPTHEGGNPLERTVLAFDPARAAIELIQGRMELNNAFRDGKVWQLGRSTLHALRTDNGMTVLCLAYHKLLDLWIHDHSSNRLYPVENVWKGSSLHAFQLTTSFYKITISFPTPASSPSPPPLPNNAQPAGKNYTFYMENPRSKLFQFFDYEHADAEDIKSEGHQQQQQQSSSWASTARFHISIVTDQLVFLPSRDASFLINGQADRNQITTPSPSKTDPTTAHPTTTHTVASTVAEKSEPATTTHASRDSTADGGKRLIIDRSFLGGDGGNPIKVIPGKLTSPRGKNLSRTTPMMLRSGTKLVSSTPTTTTTTTTTKSKVELMASTASSSPPTHEAQLNSTPPSAHPSTSSSPVLSEPGDDGRSPEGFNITSSEPTHHQLNKVSLETAGTFGSSSSHFFPQNKSGGKIREGLLDAPPREINTNNVTGHVNNSAVVLTTTNLPPVTTPITNTTATSTVSSSSGGGGNGTLSSSASVPLPSPGPSLAAGGGAKTNKPNLIFTNSTKRIPKGLVKVAGNGKTLADTSSSRDSKAVNLHAVKKAGTILILEKNKSGESYVAAAGLAKVRAAKETTPVADPLNESLRTNRVQSWNVSRLDHDKDDHHDGTGEEVRSGGGTTNKSGPAVLTTPTNPTTPQSSLSKYDTAGGGGGSGGGGSDDDAVHVTLSVEEQLSLDRISSSSSSSSSSSISESSSSSSSGPESSFEDESRKQGAGGSSAAQSYGSSEMALETLTAIKSVGIQDGAGIGASYSSMLFFAVSLSIFAVFGMVLFVRRCVKCPPRRESVLLKEPPPIRYSVIPDELSYHTPIV